MTVPKALVVVAILSVGAILAGTGGADDAPRPPGKESPAAKAPATPAKITVRGTLLDADGTPIPDVPVRLWSFRTGDKVPDPVAKTAADGTFQFEADPKDAVEEARVVLTPPGRPAHWTPLSRFTSEQTLRLPADDIPFTGRIMTLENQPLKGVTVDVVRVSNLADGNLTAWLVKNVGMRNESYWLNEGGLVTLPGGLVAAKPKTTTDAEGKFKLTGFGRDRVLTVRVYGPNVETKFFWVVTRPGGPKDAFIKTEDYNHGVYPPDVTVMLAPSRPLVGTVRDSKTGDPVAGVKVSEVNSHIVWGTTDKDGKYRLDGVPKKKNYGLTVCGAKGVPYFDHTTLWAADVAGLDPLETNLTIHRGLELTGRVVDKTGRPVSADVWYSPNGDNPNAKPNDFRVISSDGWKTKPDGTFYLTVWPGKGVLDIRAKDGSKYASADVEKVLSEAGIRSRPTGRVHALLPIDADEARPESLKVTITLQEGLIRKGTVVGPDGKPALGVVAAGIKGGMPGPLTTAEFNLSGMSSTSRRLLLFLDDGKKLGAIQPVSGDVADPVAVKLQPLASAHGEVRLTDNKSPAGLTVTAFPTIADAEKYENLPSETSKMQGLLGMQKAPWWKLTKRTATTDKDGRFRLEGLIPGLQYAIYVSDGDLGEPGTLVARRPGVKVESGKLIDLGTLRKDPDK
jgi:protocatechuate 3,4-dioxygenase beta subunit